MTDSSLLAAQNQLPEATYLKNYQAPSYWIDDIALSFDLNDDHTLVTSRLQIRHNPLTISTNRTLVLNGEELSLVSIRLNGMTLTADQYQLTDLSLTIPLADDQVELEVINKIYPEKNTALSGLYRSANTYCTQCEAEGFRRITYFLDRPDVLSRYTTTIIADKSRYPILLSNGNIIASGEFEDGRHWVTFEDPFKKPCYLFALVAGDFDLLSDEFITQSARKVALRIYVEKGYANQAHHAMYCVKEAMRWDEVTYGREYDLDNYMIVAISDFNMGAMENKGLNIFNTKYVLAKPDTATNDDYIHILSVIGHEYFHNWSGNRVTCRDWFQLSLKEGLTIFRDQSFTEDTLSAVMRIRDVNYLREVQFSEDAGPLTHPVRPDSYIEINNFYTATIYNKGAEVLRMLQTILGKKQFRQGMDLYFSRYDGQAVTIEDYIQTMEEISGISLSQFRRWYSQSRTPLVTAEDDYDEENKIYSLSLHQTCEASPNQPEKQAFYIPIRMGLLDQKGDAIALQINDEAKEFEKIITLTQSSEIFRFHEVPSRPIPSLLRNFSAPIKLEYDYSNDELAFLFKHDKDAFNRWEAGQKYALNLLLSLIDQFQRNQRLELPVDWAKQYDDILTHQAQDKFLLSEYLNLPSEKYTGEQMQVIDVDATHAAREFALQFLAEQLQSTFLTLYKDNQTSSEQFTIKEIGQRELKNTCLRYLMRLPKYHELGMQQFEKNLTTNMTDTQAALVALANIQSPLREKALQQFYTTWRNDALVVDKWFSIQAVSKLPNALREVRKLMHHEAFDLKNPNKVYALIGAFAFRNLVAFHAMNGEGYAFLRETVQQLDALNPQVAARMLKPLTNFKRYDKERQKLMREQLEILLQKNISNDIYELASKSLS